MKIWDSYNAYRLALVLDRSIQLSTLIADLGHEIQKERGMSAGYLGEGTENPSLFHSILELQRQKTDLRLHRLETYLLQTERTDTEMPVMNRLSQARNSLEQISSIRSRVDNRTITVDEEILRYSQMNHRLFEILPMIVKIAKSGELKCELSAISSLVMAKERLGILRATGSNTFANKGFGQGMHTRFVGLRGEYDGYIHIFNTYANPEIVRLFREKMSDPNLQEFNKLEQILVRDDHDAIRRQDPVQWFDAISYKIDLIADVRKVYADQLHEDVEKIYSKAYQDILFSVIIIPVMFLMVLWTSTKVSKSLYDEIREQQHMMLQQSKMATMGEMIGSIAHQWRQPLNTVGVMVQEMTLKWRLGKLDDAESERLTDGILSTLEYMSGTIDDFRNFFKPSKEQKVFDVVKVIDDALMIVGKQIESHGIEVSVFKRCGDSCPKEEFWINGYESEFKQVVINIINNAREAIIERAAKEGRCPKNIQIELDRAGEFLYLYIRDTGGGIAESVIHRIFEPYVSTKESKNGTGLGLYMSKMIIENSMHGELKALNVPDGAEFKIVLKAFKVDGTKGE